MVKLESLFSWCRNRGSPLAEEASKYLEERKEQLEVALAEQAKAKKGKKKGKDEEPEINQDEYGYISEDILCRMVRERMSQEDCNAGVIFDCLESEYWADAKFAIKLISDALPQQNLQVLLMKFQKDFAEGEEEGVDVCTNYRFARRK